MCQLSTQIKFCTCSAAEAGNLKNYWVLHRPADLDFQIMGLPIMPKEIDKHTDLLNRKNLLLRINQPGAFDIAEKPLENDKLELHFNYGTAMGEFITYTYEFKNGQWHEKEFGFFELENICYSLTKGKIESALK